MSNWIIVILCAVAAVALFVAGMSLTLMLKGHHIDSEISTNKEMQRRGIKCAVQETREAMQQADCSDKYCVIQNACQIISRGLARTDARNEAALFLDIVCYFQWIKGNGSIEICKEYTK